MIKPISKSDVTGIFAGAVGGLLIQSAAITAVFGASYMTLITKWGRYAVSIALVVLFCAFYKTMSQTQALIASLVAGAIIPSLISKFVFGSGTPWFTLFAFGFLFSVIALIIFRFFSHKLA